MYPYSHFHARYSVTIADMISSGSQLLGTPSRDHGAFGPPTRPSPLSANHHLPFGIHAHSPPAPLHTLHPPKERYGQQMSRPYSRGADFFSPELLTGQLQGINTSDNDILESGPRDVTTDIFYSDSSQPYGGVDFLSPGQLQGLQTSENDIPEPLYHPRLFSEVDISHNYNLTPVNARNTTDSSDLSNAVNVSPRRRISNGTARRTRPLPKRMAPRFGDPRPPDAFSTLSRSRSGVRLFECFSDCRQERFGQNGFKRRGNLVAHLRKYHKQIIPKGGVW